MDFNYVLNHCHWIKKVSNYEYDMFLDHHSLSSFRSCEQYFVRDHIEGWKTKKEIAKMPWFFAIGITIHDALEWMYNRKHEDAFRLEDFINQCGVIWMARNMETYSDTKEYNTMGGLTGFCGMMAQYAIFYSNDTERLKIIGTEIVFGKGKEVLLGSFETEYGDQVSCYLAGRIDFLMDNGRAVGPMDHKSMGYVDSDPVSKYNPQDGMTGYVFAAKQIIEKNFPEIASKRQLNMIWMNFLGVSNTSDSNKRFKRLPMYKTDWQLEQYRLRNITTFKRIFSLITSSEEPQWNTNVCSNMFRRDCQYKHAHQQNSLESVLQILNMDFEQKPIWNPDLSHEEK